MEASLQEVAVVAEIHSWHLIEHPAERLARFDEITGLFVGAASSSSRVAKIAPFPWSSDFAVTSVFLHAVVARLFAGAAARLHVGVGAADGALSGREAHLFAEFGVALVVEPTRFGAFLTLVHDVPDG